MGGSGTAATRRWPTCIARSASAPGPTWRRALAFIGPGYLVAVGYMDPGNWATSLAGGSQFGYTLLVVALVSNIMAIILQSLCARLAIASGRDLAQACRDAYPRPVAWPLWLLAELAIIATDLAEVIGTAIGLNLLFGIPLEIGVIITALDVFLILYLQKLGLPLDRGVRSSRCSASSPSASASRSRWPIRNWGDVIRGFAPTTEIVTNPDMLYLALGILGATVMPHNLYLHSGIVQTRAYGDTLPGEARGAEIRDHRLHRRADVRAADQRLDPDPRGGDLPRDRPDRGRRARRGACAARAAARARHRADAVRHRAALLRPQLDRDGDDGRPDRHGGLPRHPAAALAAAADHPRHRHRAGRRRDHLVRRERHGAAADPHARWCSACSCPSRSSRW